MRQKIAPAWFVILIVLMVVSAWIGLGFLPATNRVPFFDFTRNGKVDPSLPGFFGDSFGWINSLFSALAFAGVLLTLWIQRHELQLQREDMKRVAKGQEESEKREALATYINALESLRKLSEWRMAKNPAITKVASFPVAHRLVIQARVIQLLHAVVNELEPEIRKLYPSLKSVSEEGSQVWRLEELLKIYTSLQGVLESHSGSSDDSAKSAEACNLVQCQLERLKAVKASCGPQRQGEIDAILQTASGPGCFRDLAKTEEQLLHLIMSMCYE